MKCQFSIDNYVELSAHIPQDNLNSAICGVVRALRDGGIDVTDTASVLALADSLYTLELMGLKLVEDEKPKTALSGLRIKL